MATPLTHSDGQALLTVARAAIAARLTDQAYAPPSDLAAALYAPGAAFVTLHLRGQLRGCIGALEARGALVDSVAAMAVRAAFHDPRFPPLTAAEWAGVTLDISCLSAPEPVAGPGDVVAGRHGVVLEQSSARGVFLPQVATEQGWDRETLLSQLARKAGLPQDAWRDAATRLSVFEAQVFAEA